MQHLPVKERVSSKAVRDINASARSNDWLSQCAYDDRIPTYTSQRGEDRILQKLFEVIGTTNEWCVEFGAMGGKHFANTWYWIAKRGWKSVQIEAARDWNLNLRTPGRESFDALKERFKDNDRVTCINRWVDAAGDNRLDAILAKTPLPREFDLLSADVDSTDYAIWDSVTDYSPRVVVIEHIKTIPLATSFHSNRGSNLRAFVELGKRKGYELVAANDLNAVFVRNDLFEQLGIQDNAPEKLWNEQEQYQMFLEERDGSLVLSGDDKLRWVRGVDGTVVGQLREGKYVVVSPEEKSVEVSSPVGMSTYVSGLIRHLWWSLSQS